MEEPFGLDSPHNQSQIVYAQVVIYVTLVILVNPITVLAAWWMSRRPMFWPFQMLALMGSLLWMTFLFRQLPTWQMEVWGKGLLWWGGITLVIPGLASVLKGVQRGCVLLRPHSLAESVDDQRLQQARRTEILSQTAAQQSQQQHNSTTPGYLSLGPCMASDHFPAHLGISQENAWLQLSGQTLSQHLLIIGTTGTGKSETIKRLIAETLHKTERDIFFLDGKGDLSMGECVAQMIYQARGRAVPLFLMGLSRQGSAYDGFRGDPADIYNRLCALVGVEDAVGNAAYYADVNREILQLMCLTSDGAPRSFEEVLNRLDLSWLARAHAADMRNRVAVSRLNKEAIHGLQMRLSPLARELSPLVGPGGFVLEEQCGAVFTLRTQSVGDTSRRFLRFFVEDVKDFVGKRQQRPGLLIIDEFGAFHNENILSLLTLARSANLGVVLATQDIASLGSAQTQRLIMANTRTKLLMATDYPEEVARLAGTVMGLETSIQHRDGEATGAGSAYVQQHFRIEANEVARLQPGEAFLIRQRYVAKFKVKPVGGPVYQPSAIAQFRRRSDPVQGHTEPVDLPPIV